MITRTRFFVATVSAVMLLVVTLGTTIVRSPHNLKRGEDTYQAVCAQCHGETGQGDGSVSAFLRVKPRDFSRAQFKFRSTGSGQLPLDEDLFRTIAGGLPNTAMPGYRELEPAVIGDVIEYIKTFSPRWKDAAEYPLDTVHVGTPVALTAESVRRGRVAYIKAKCWECHGNQGRGDGPNANTQLDDKKNRLITNDLTHLWESKVGRTPELVWKVFTTGLNGTTMPSYKDALTEQERWDLSNYVIALADEHHAYDALVISTDDDDDAPAKSK